MLTNKFLGLLFFKKVDSFSKDYENNKIQYGYVSINFRIF